MSTNDFLTVSYDETLAQPAADAVTLYPVIQWSHNPGGWLLPLDRAEEFDVTLPWPKRTVRLGSNDVECYYSDGADVAILASTKRWFVMDENDRPRYLEHYQEGARSKTHALAIVKGSPDLFVLSMKGATSADFHGGLGKLQAAMKRVNAVRPPYFFWLKLAAGAAVRLSKGATVAPLVLEQPAKGDDVIQWLAARFTGADFVAIDVGVGCAEAIREFTKPRTNGDAEAEATNGHDATMPQPLPATGPAPTNATAPAPWSNDFDALPSASAGRDVALVLAKKWSHEDAVQWSLTLGVYADEAEAKGDYRWLWDSTKAKNGGRIMQLPEWWPVWIDSVLAIAGAAVAVEEPGF